MFQRLSLMERIAQEASVAVLDVAGLRTVFFCDNPWEKTAILTLSHHSGWGIFSPPPPRDITENDAISRSARAITLARNMLRAQPRARLRNLCNSYLVV